MTGCPTDVSLGTSSLGRSICRATTFTLSSDVTFHATPNLPTAQLLLMCSLHMIRMRPYILACSLPYASKLPTFTTTCVKSIRRWHFHHLIDLGDFFAYVRMTAHEIQWSNPPAALKSRLSTRISNHQ